MTERNLLASYAFMIFAAVATNAAAAEPGNPSLTIKTADDTYSRLAAPQPLAVRSKSLQTSDYILRLVELRKEAFTPARIAPLGGPFLLGVSLQNEHDVQLIDLDRAQTWPLGKVSIEKITGIKHAVWPRVLNLVTLSVTQGKDADGITRPLNADVLMFGSTFDGTEGRRCQFVFVKTLRFTFSEKPEVDAVEDWFDSPCVPNDIGNNHSWESGGGLELVPTSERRDPENLEFYLGLGHFHAVHDKAWMSTLSETDRNTLTAVIRVTAPGKWDVIATGLRNTQGLVNVSVPGIPKPILVGTDQGPFSGDEINIIEPGNHYGWPDSTFGGRYDERDRYAAESERFHVGGTRPVYYFPETGTAASPIIQVHGGAFSDAWAPDPEVGLTNLIVGAMARGWLYRIVFDGQKVLAAEPMDLGFRTRTIIELEDRIAIGSDEGVVAFLYPEQVRIAGKFQPINPDRPLASLPTTSSIETSSTSHDSATELDGDATRGAVVFNRCRNCHTLAADGKSSGPSLHGVFGSRPSDDKDYQFSEAMLKANPQWDAATLDRFIEQPRKFLPGTKMLFQGISDPQDRADLITYLKLATK